MTASNLEWRAEPGTGHVLRRNRWKTVAGLHVRYRRKGQRRWTTFFFAGGTSDRVEDAVRLHAERISIATAR